MCRLIIPSSAWATAVSHRRDRGISVSADHSFVSLGNVKVLVNGQAVNGVSADHSFVSLGNCGSCARTDAEDECRLIIPSSAWATLIVE